MIMMMMAAREVLHHLMMMMMMAAREVLHRLMMMRQNHD